MIWLIGLVQLASLVAPSVAACTGGQGFVPAVGTVISNAAACSEGAAVGQAKLGGTAASACNRAQMTYAALEAAELAGMAARCHCKEAYYDDAKTLADVDLWTDCIGPVNILIVSSAKAVRDYQLAHARDIFAPCSVCTDAKFAAIEATVEQVQTVLDFALDWKGKLRETEVEMLKEGVKAVVISAAVGNGVPNGAPSPSTDFIVSIVTKGSSSTTGSGSLSPRQANSTSPFISDIIGVQVRLLMVPLNGTSATLEQQLKTVFSGSDFKSNLTTWNANLTSASYAQVRGLQSANATTSATTSTSTSTSASGTAGTRSSAAPSSSTTGAASSVAPLIALLVLALSFCLYQST